MTTISSVGTPVLQASDAVEGFGKASAAVVHEVEQAAARLFSVAAAAGAAASESKQTLPPTAPRLRAPDAARVQAAAAETLAGGAEALTGDPEAQAAGTSADADLRPTDSGVRNASPARSASTGARTHAAVPTTAGRSASGAQQLTPEAMLMQLVGELQDIIGSSTAETIKARLELLRQQRVQQAATFERLSGELSQAQSEADTIARTAQEAAEQVERALRSRDEAAQRLREQRSRLEAMSPKDPGYEALRAQVVEQQAKVDTLQASAERSWVVSRNATAALEESFGTINGIDAQIDRLLVVAQPGLPPPPRLTNSAVLSELLATLSRLAAEGALGKLQSDAQLAIKMLERQQAENLRKSEEYQAEQDKAREAERTMGCVAKIVGYIIMAAMTLASILLTPFTFGLAMGIAVAGIAIGLALTIVEETTGFSVIGQALEPLMQHVIQPLLKAIGDLITKLLQMAGVDASVARQWGSIMGAIIGAIAIVVVVVAAVVVGRAAAAKLADKLMPMINKMISNVMPEIVKNASRAVGQVGVKMSGAMTKALGSSAEAVSKRLTTALVAGQVTQLANTTAAAAGKSVVAGMRAKSEETLANLENSLAESRVLRECLRRAEEEFKKANEVALNLYERISDVAASAGETGRVITSNMRSA